MARNATGARKRAGMPKTEIQIRGYVERVRFNNPTNGFSIIIISLSGESRKGKEKSESNNGQESQQSQENQGADNFFDVLLTEDQNQITCKGIMPNAKAGDEILLKGNWITDPKWGRQFSFTAFDIILPTSEQGVIAYFSGNNFYGLGRKAAEKILAALGEICLEKLKNNPDLAYSVPGLSEKQQAELAEKMKEHGALGDLIAMICRHGISAGMAGRIFAKYGAESMQIVKENPYQLIKDVDGIGFERADSIGAAVGIKKNSPFRVDAAIRHILEEAKGEGHCAMGSAVVSVKVLDLLGDGSGVDFGDVARAGRNLIGLGELFREKKDGDDSGGKGLDLVYLDGMRRAEVGLAEKIRAMVGGGGNNNNNNKGPEAEGINDEIILPLIEKMAENAGITLAPEQLQAVVWGLKYKISVVTGGPGTGKSTITKFIVAGYESVHPGHEIYLAAPTGRAAKRLSEATGKEAKTIHRLLGYNPEIGFSYDEYNQLKGPGLMVLDESSMIDIELAHNLFKAVPDDMQIVVIGDVDQLPSVGPGAVLRDIIQSGVVPVTELKFIYRQAEGSTISLLADMIKNYGRETGEVDKNGKPIKNKKMPDLRELEAMSRGNGSRDFIFIDAETPEEAHKAVKMLITDQHAKGLDPMDFMVLTPLRDRGLASAEKLNAMLRDIVNHAGTEGAPKKEKKFGDKIFRDLDKIMKVKKNDYKKGLFNGDIGTLEVSGGDGKREDLTFILDGVPVPLDTEDLAYIEPAYSYTIHKCVSLDTLIETDSGLIRIGDAKSGYVASIDGVKTYTRTTNQSKQEMLSITTEDGYRLTVTPEHGLDVWDGQKYSRFEARELKKGDWLQVGLGIRVEPLEAPKLPKPTQGDVREQVFKVPQELNPDVAEFFGLMVADGTNYGRGFRLAKRHKEVVERFSLLCYELFGVETKRYVKGGAHYAEVSSTFLCRWITSIGGMEPNKKAVPTCILAGNSIHHKSFLRGLFEDAAVNLRTGNLEMVDHIDFTTCQESLAADVQIILSRLGIVSNHVRNVSVHRHSKIYIYGEYARMFGIMIGFISHEKQGRCILEAGRQINYVIPVSREEAMVIHGLNKSTFIKNDKWNAITRGHVSRYKCSQLENMPDWLKERIANHHTRIVSIEQVMDESTCLHVPEGHRFLQNAISGWNSQGSESPTVVVICIRSHYIMLSKPIIYTGITRGKVRLAIVGSQEAFEIAVKNNKVVRRYGLLKERLRGEI